MSGTPNDQSLLEIALGDILSQSATQKAHGEQSVEDAKNKNMAAFITDLLKIITTSQRDEVPYCALITNNFSKTKATYFGCHYSRENGG